MTPGERVAQVALDVLRDGPMGHTIRGDDYERFLEAAFGNGRQLRRVATSCAIFAGACLIQAGIQGRRAWPERRAITTWLGVPGFTGSWIPADQVELQVGDIFYVASDRGKLGAYAWSHWQAAANGHVGMLVEGERGGPMWRTAEGGGSPGGTICRLSDSRKNINELSRPLRGVWRPSLMVPRTGPAIRTLRLTTPRMTGDDVRAVQVIVGAKPDGVFGPLTYGAISVWQTQHGLTMTGEWSPLERNRAEHDTEPQMQAVTPEKLP
jgi:hypothetical protein